MILSKFLKVIEVKVIAVEVETSSENSESYYLNFDNSLVRLVEL
jgi:hypothetical protein